jgi:succinyl-CoA synthetase beta subunit
VNKHQRPRSEHQALAFLALQGVPVVPATLASDAAQAVAAARTLGGSVVVKVASPDIAHKSDIGGVVLNLQGDDAVRAAVQQVLQAAQDKCPTAQIEGVIVAPMRERGIELFVGYTRDPQWGPVLAVGLGGVWVEILQDVALRPLPVDAREIKRMLTGLRGAKLLTGQRGVPAADLDAVAGAIERIAQAIMNLGPDLEALDVNPLWVRGSQVEALDALFVWRGSEDTPSVATNAH